ncbi:hypothetical protein Poli38472_000880 [Pythium oligandrum]|uniref:HTH La-type RNA-binding domain-containing protein n=1 Tax=Pythium oligandrum TaxID=41045 RepID=A0A8K1FJK8_PYTOL|nr:hypothetical protein Poli38472_000880 [Pythium oligandrum]|eukprot:TMW60838.1 hypothetical protein Poli38472_000880 [Pythium oligandrum]
MSAEKKTQKLVGEELKKAIKQQVEFYFSRANLANDAYLVSQMNSQMYVPVDTIIAFGKIKQLTESAALLVEAVADSTVVSLNETKDAIKPTIKSERNTIILREIPSATQPEEVKAIFEGSGEVVNVRSDVGDTWFVTMASEDDAVKTLLALRSKTFNNAPIKARLKSENLLRSFYPTQQVEPVVAASGVSAYARGYYATGPAGGYYDNYGAQYGQQRGAYANGAGNQRNQGGRGQGAQFRQGQGRGNANQQGKESRAKSNSFDQQRPASRKAKDKKGKGQQAAAQQQNSGNAKRASGTAERQPVLNSANFPPLPANGEKPVAAPEVIKYQYAHEDILEIVKHMDEDDCKLPEGKMDYEAHSVALTPIAHPDLLRNQRTYSIEQAREAMRQGRPIRSDSIGSIDYESMMYGEDYTKEARELRKQNAESSAPAAEAPKASQPKVLGYAAAVIHGTPAPQPTEPVKKAPAKTPKAEKGDKPAKDEKKAPKKTTKQEGKKEESAPKTGAWGGRNFLDVVKSEPPNAPPAPAAAAPAAPAAPVTAKKGDAKQSDRKEKDKNFKERRASAEKQ